MSDRIRQIVMALIEELYTGTTEAEWHEAIEADTTEPRVYEDQAVTQ